MLAIYYQRMKNEQDFYSRNSKVNLEILTVICNKNQVKIQIT